MAITPSCSTSSLAAADAFAGSLALSLNTSSTGWPLMPPFSLTQVSHAAPTLSIAR